MKCLNKIRQVLRILCPDKLLTLWAQCAKLLASSIILCPVGDFANSIPSYWNTVTYSFFPWKNLACFQIPCPPGSLPSCTRLHMDLRIVPRAACVSLASYRHSIASLPVSPIKSWRLQLLSSSPLIARWYL